jgi:hypothetical protein
MDRIKEFFRGVGKGLDAAAKEGLTWRGQLAVARTVLLWVAGAAVVVILINYLK